VYALSVADKFVRVGESKCALVVGAETLTRIVDWTDRGTCVLFADGAGAVILKPAEQPGIISTRLHSDGRYKDLLMYPDGVSKGFHLVRQGKAGVQMKGNEVYKVAVNTLGQLVTETLNAHNISKAELDWLIPHQANLRIIEAIARRLELPMDRVIVTIGEQGNTSAASVPLALDTGIRDGRVRRGQLLLLEAFGGGFTWGSALIRY
jgi:3-oxoacyl-[acyl-carrier-protein] synthase-3